MSYRITTELDEMNFDVIYEFLSESYWAKGMPKSVLQKSMENSLCFAALGSGELAEQVGFARVITDKATFAYLADVFVLEAHRGRGLSTQMMNAVTNHKDLQGLRRFMLATSDAHGLYEKYGFERIIGSDILMQLHNPDVYIR